MDPIRRLVQLLGNDGAVANARCMCDRHLADEAAVRALAERLDATRPVTAGTVSAA
jgi:hypothetical protein